MKSFSVHGAPSEYIFSEGVLEQLQSKLIERGLKKVLIVHGVKSWEAAKPFWPELNDIEVEEYVYGGECSLSEIDKVANLVEENSFDGVIAVGGGKVLDLVKATCNQTHRQAILVPTLPSNCSPWAAVSVLYDDAGTFIRYDVYPVSASLVLIEPRILIDAPVSMLIAGIGDTLAKWYEADVQMSGIDNKPVPLQISYFAAKQCKDLLLQHSKGAISAAKAGQLNDDFMKVVETIITMAGLVGGFGDYYGRVAAAHSIHNGLTILEETHHALHGEKVAYGILVQLVLEGKWDEIEQLIPIYRDWGLPISVSEIGVQNLTQDMITAVAQKAVIPEESIHVMPMEITAEKVASAISELENKVAVLNYS
ncbi:putative oxidoreductase [Neobacillus niacini]|uniref:iron-containing alcohol dehydrogenase family protein n=1 Tax=Neobacillus niacini TaxID=86668 RepID=UPI0028629D72|nr:iron-containing alcohol dehydrogenase family protein [Neobacillus niacini]MDR7078492.1 putative oxidoreductase [Neobacillus niacini]